MPKRCIICDEDAVFCIKDTSDFYCRDCAKEYFSDISMLLKVEEQAQRIKDLIDDKGSTLKAPDEEEKEDPQTE